MCFDVINELAVKKRKDQESTEIDADLASFIECLNIPNCDEEIPPVVIGKKSKKKNQRETGPQQLSAGEMVLVDMEKYADEWPQVAQIISIGDTNISMQWFKGSKSTAWTPATRRVTGCRGGKTEPFTEIVNKSVIWHGGFSLTPSGLLPKAIKEAIDCYFDE